MNGIISTLPVGVSYGLSYIISTVLEACNFTTDAGTLCAGTSDAGTLNTGTVENLLKDTVNIKISKLQLSNIS